MMNFLLLFAFFVGCRYCILLLAHLGELGLKTVFKDFNFVLERKDLLILHFHCHLKGHELVLHIVPL